MADLRTRRASLAPATFNRATRTVEAILSTGASVQRRDARGPFGERLDTSMGAWTARAPMPVLDTHRQGSIGDILGTVTAVRADGGLIVATITVTDDRALGLIESGALTGVSIGYRVQAWAETDRGRTRTATRWEIVEVSLVPVPADPAAILRSDPMPNDTATTDRVEVNAATRTLAATLGLGAGWADSQIDAGHDVLTVRANAATELEHRAAAGPPRIHQIGQSGDDPAVIATRQAEALVHRMIGGELPEPARQYGPLGLADHARLALAARGESGVQFMGRDALLQRAIATGDLPNLLTGTGNRVLQASYTAAPSPLKALARQVTATDFRARTTVRLGEMAGLERVPESGEVTHGGVAEAAENYAVETYARTFALTRQALINDDLGAFATITAAQGRAAAETENRLLVTLLTQGSGGGPVMSDTIRLFHSSHGNLAGSGTVIDTTNLGAGRLAMRSQKGLDAATPINAAPKYLLVSATKETQAETVLASIYAATGATANLFANRLELLVEPRLTGNAWYLFADPATQPVLEYAYLASAPGPQMESRPGWDVLGMEFRVVLDFGCGAVDWRGAYRNPGA